MGQPNANNLSNAAVNVVGDNFRTATTLKDAQDAFSALTA